MKFKVAPCVVLLVVLTSSLTFAHETVFSGLVPAVFTPFHDDASVNYDAIKLQAASLRNVSSVFVCGTTGESMSLSIDERKKILETWKANIPAGVKLIAHIGTASVAESKVLGAHACSLGVDAIGSMPPFFFRPSSIEDLVDVVVDIAESCSDVPFFYYHIPTMTGVKFRMSDFVPQVTSVVQNYGGTKFSDYDLLDFSITAKGSDPIWIGKDEILLQALTSGAGGAVGSTYNFASPVFNSIVTAYEKGDIATAIQLQEFTQDFIELVVYGKYSGVSLSAQKAIMKMLGADIGFKVRLPQMTLPDTQYAELKKDLDDIKFFHYVPPFSL